MERAIVAEFAVGVLGIDGHVDVRAKSLRGLVGSQ
jgi:hypothetical protein